MDEGEGGAVWTQYGYTDGMSRILLCLHGWGGSKESFRELRDALKETDLLILTPDLPGFGDEPEPDRPWSVDEYADWVEQWYKRQSDTSQQPIALLGHSHGGRIAIKLAARHSPLTTHNSPLLISHLYLCAAAGIHHPRVLRRSVGFLLAKIGALVFRIPGIRALEPQGKKVLYRLMRVHDYERASPIMRETMRRVRNEDLTTHLSSITVPTDIFWGTDDTMTPLKDGRLMHRLIKGSHLHVFPGIRHRVHRDKAQDIASVIRSQVG